MKNEKVIGECTLKEIRKEDGAQLYEYNDGNTEWLMGWNRASNVSVGDRGTMVLVHTSSFSLPFFRKIKADPN